MKRTIPILILCILLGACAPHSKSNTSDPIENLVDYLDKQGQEYVFRHEWYEGGSFLKTRISYSIHCIQTKASDGKKMYPEIQVMMRRKEELIDSCFSAFRWGCSFAQQCYHKENHVLGKDSVLYALALDGLDGEKTELEGTGNYEYWNVGYKAARAATLRYNGSKEIKDLQMDYIIRESTSGEAPFDMQPLVYFINKKVEQCDSVEVYNTSYEYTAEDWQDFGTLLGEASPAFDYSREGKTTGHLYVFPPSIARSVHDELKQRIMNHYIRSNPQQTFSISMYQTYSDPSVWFLKIKGKFDWQPYLLKKTYKHQSLQAAMSDNRYYILVLDETEGAYAIPSDWMHTLRIKDHKAERIPEK
ncbi:MAG: hypothetical protein J6Y84_05285 [Bacteroidaceae bacterium]|nr:hypothetical protein [Bacteroidaceae bacterium]